MRSPVFKYSGLLMNLKRTRALSPVRKQSLDISTMVAVCRTLPTCTEKTQVPQLIFGQNIKYNEGKESTLTHGLILDGYRGGMVQHEQLSLEVPAGFRLETW